MPTIKELHELHLRQLDASLAESALLLQREGGLDGELKTSGALCERFVRATLERFIVPGHFRITSGFIATPELLRSEANLPQCDILIVERSVPPLLRFYDADIEVVPREGVCGIIEVKRTLTESTIKGAISHIGNIVNAISDSGTFKTDQSLNRFNRHVGLHNHSSDKPLLGIISLQSQLSDLSGAADQIASSDSLLDFLWTLDGNALLPCFKSDSGARLYTHTARPITRTWSKLLASDFAEAESPFYRAFNGHPLWLCLSQANQGLDRSAVFSRVLGVVSLMLTRVFALSLREAEIDAYYLSHS